MADDYWNRQQPLLPSPAMLKRPRTDYELPASGLSTGHDMHNYLASDDRGGPRSVKDTQTIGSAYDRYLQSVQLSSFTSGEVPTHGEMGMGRPVANRMPVGNRMPGPLLPDPIVMSRPPAVSPDLAPNGRNIEYGNHLPVDSMSRPGRETVPLPPDASNTLYVEGLPPDSSRREVARILFIGGDATSKLILIFFFTFQLFTEKRKKKKNLHSFIHIYVHIKLHSFTRM
uniref:Uncharacterized protein n=1 Tax=Cucumis melo TaxID=3656 RepID=A0A9I9CUA5_CUCME